MGKIKQLYTECLQCSEKNICTTFLGEKLTEMEACQQSMGIKSNDDMLADEHDKYLQEATQSGVPLWVLHQNGPCLQQLQEYVNQGMESN